ncbi:MAG: CHAT domain-containing tetratricopeptide repeat protein [Cyanobacteria bacterium P01_A01_bin.116]
MKVGIYKLFINSLKLLLLSSLILAEHAPLSQAQSSVPVGPSGPTGISLPPLPPPPDDRPLPDPRLPDSGLPDSGLPTPILPTPNPTPLPGGPLSPQPGGLLTIATLQGHLPPLAPAVVDLAIVSTMLPEVGFPQGGTFQNPTPTPTDIPSIPTLPGGPDVPDVTSEGEGAIAQVDPSNTATPQSCHSQLGQIQSTTASQRTSSTYESVIGCYEAALETTLTTDNAEVQNTVLNDLAITHYIIGNYRRALEVHQQQRDLARTSGNATQEGIALSGMGSAYAALGNYDQAIEHYTQALGLIDPIFAGQWHTLTLRNLGNAYYAKKDFSRALQYQENALRLSLQSGDRYGEMQALGNIGNVHMALGDFAKSVEAYDQSLALAQSQNNALEIAQIQLGLGTAYANQQDYARAVSYYQESLSSARTLGSKLGEGIALTNLGHVQLQLNQLPEAASHLQQGIEVWESLRAGLGTHDDFKISLFETQRNAYRNLQEVLVMQNQPNRALEIAERGRSRAFVELLARETQPGDPAIPSSATSSAAPPSLAQIKQVATRNQATLVEYTLIREQFTETPHGQSVQYTTQPQETALYIWVIKPTGEVTFRQVDLTQQNLNASLAEQVLAARQDLGIRRGGLQTANASESSSQAHLQDFHQLLIAPIADLLPTDPNEPVVFIPQEQLFMVPFAALQDSAGAYLIEQHTVLSAPSIQVIDLAQTLAQQRSPRASVGQSLIVGNPSPLPQIMEQPFADLPHAKAEANAIGELLSAPALTGATATEATIKQQLSTANIIHLATHGFYDEKSPMQGALALAVADDQQDGLLTAREISALSLQAELAVLSACDTGLGQITGDGVVGLSRAFITAGTPSVMVSLWQVSDQATADLMIEFYRQRQQNLGNAQALRQAMLKVMATHQDPADWSAFTLTGKIQ